MIDKTNDGFTLIELVVVVAIIVTIATVAFFAIGPVEIQRKTRDNTRIENLQMVAKAIGIALADSSKPAHLSSGQQAISSISNSRNADGTGWVGGVDISKYLPTLPVDPQNGQTGRDAKNQTVVFQYTYSSDGRAYKLTSYLESSANAGRYDQDGGSSAAKYEIFSPGGKDLP